MAKYYIEKQQRGKYYFYKVMTASGEKLRKMIKDGAKLFDDRPSASKYASGLKNKD